VKANRKLLIGLLILPYILTRAQYIECQYHKDALGARAARVSNLYRQGDEYVWIGTENGLIRYDGSNSEIYLRKELNTQKVTAMETEGDSLWVGYEDGGIAIFYNEKLTPVFADKKIISRITGIKLMENGSKIITTYGSGLFIYSRDGQLLNYNSDDGILSDEIYCLEKIRKNSIAIGTDMGVQVISVQMTHIDCVITEEYADLKKEIIYTLAWNEKYQSLAAGTFENGLHVILQNKREKLHFWSGKTITQLTANDPENFYFLVPGHTGLYSYHLPSSSLKRSEVCSEEKTSPELLYCDDTGTIWLYEPKQGLKSIDSRFFIVLDGLKNVQALAVCDSLLYFADENRLFEHNTGTVTNSIIKSDVHVLSLLTDCQTGKLYCGTFGEGIMIYDRSGKSVSFFTEKQGLLNNNVISMAKKDQEIWAATLGGITVWNITTGKIRNFTKKEGLTTGYNYSLFVDSKKQLWVGTDGFGLLTVSNEGVINPIPSRHSILSITEDKNGTIWYSTTSGELYNIQHKTGTPQSFENGVFTSGVSGIIGDNQGRLNIFHPNGMDILDPENQIVRNYGNNQKFRQINAHLHALASDTYGNIWFSDEKRIIQYTPAPDMPQLRLIIQQFNTGDDHRHIDKKGALLFHSNDLQIAYTAIWMDNPSAPAFRYKIVGLSDRWIYTKDKKLIFPNMRPGKYKFILQCDTQESFTWPVVYEQAFEILTPFYRATWFYIICIVSCFLLAVQIIRSREKRKRYIQQLTNEKMKSELEMIKSQIDPHFLFNSFNTLISTIETNKEAALEFAGRMADFYRTVLEYRNKDLIPLDEELNIASDYLYLLQVRFGKGLQIDNQITHVTDDQIIPLTLQIIIENVVKHNVVSVHNPLKIEISITEDRLKVRNEIRLRRDKTPSTHFGLEALMKRYSNIAGKNMTAGPQDGFFEVTIPLIKKI
jgi:ligand-binding sensor domain-containing protein